jgi:phosphoglycolate phosphatase-like HAD superfamily hydrolase
MYAQYDGLIFDMDGTLLDTEPTHRQAWTDVLGRYGMRFDLQAMIALNGSPTWRIAQAVIELNQADLDPHLLAREKTDAVKAMLLDTVRPLPLIDVVKSGTGVARCRSGRAAKARLQKPCSIILACATIFLPWSPPIMLNVTSPHRTPSCFAQN